MNTSARLQMAASVGLLIWACAYQAAGAPSTKTIEIRQGVVLVDGHRFDRTTKLSEYETALGKPDRATGLKNTIYTYDNLGIRLYQRPGEDTVMSISLDFVKADFEFSPKTTFKGAFKVNGEVVGLNFPKSRLPVIRGVQIDPAFKTLELPVITASQDKIILTFEYLSSSTRLDGVGIAWRETHEPAGGAKRRQPSSSETNRTSGAAGSGG